MFFPVISVVLSLVGRSLLLRRSGRPRTARHAAVGARDALLRALADRRLPADVHLDLLLRRARRGARRAASTASRRRSPKGFSAANGRLGLIAAWSLLACTVGLALRLLGGAPAARRPYRRVRCSALAWSLATLFAIPILAYEGLGPFATVERSTQIFKRRWGAPDRRLDRHRRGGRACSRSRSPCSCSSASRRPAAAASRSSLLAGAGLFALGPGVAAMEQIYRVFVYRSAVGLDTSAGPFSQQRPALAVDQAALGRQRTRAPSSTSRRTP